MLPLTCVLFTQLVFMATTQRGGGGVLRKIRLAATQERGREIERGREEEVVQLPCFFPISCFNDSASAGWICTLRDSVCSIFIVCHCCCLLPLKHSRIEEFWFYSAAGSICLMRF